MNPLLKEYVETVAGGQVSDQAAQEFLDGLDDFNQTVVEYDVKEDGFLVTKQSIFDTLKAAMAFVRKLQSYSKPVIR